MTRFSTLATALPLALAACGGPEDSQHPDEPAELRIESTRLVVDANGLTAKGAVPLRFGASRADVDAVAAKAYGAEPERSSNGECGAGPMEFSQFGPLQLAYQDGRFAGWFLREGDGFATNDGIRPGMTMVELKALRAVRELDTTLEGEFEYTTADFGTITGFAEDGRTIAALQAGLSCFFR